MHDEGSMLPHYTASGAGSFGSHPSWSRYLIIGARNGGKKGQGNGEEYFEEGEARRRISRFNKNACTLII